MTLYHLQYWSALDNALIRKGALVLPQNSTLVAPSGWDSDEVSEAFINQHPGSSVLLCIPVADDLSLAA